MATVAASTAPNRSAGSHPAIGFARVPQRAAPLNVARICGDSLAIMALLLLNKGGTAGSMVCFAILALMVAKSPSAAFKALAICYLGLMLNHALVPKTLVWTPGRLVLPLLAFVRFSIDMATLRASLLTTRFYAALLLYVAVMAACSLLGGWFVNIALLKLFNFWAVLSAIYCGVVVLRAKRVDLTEWFVSLILSAIAFGLIAIAIGQDRNYYGVNNESGLFNGAFSHPNCHSLYASQFVIFLASIVLLGQYHNVWIATPMIAIWTVFMLMSQARTSILATAIGFITLIIFAKPLSNRFGWRIRLNISKTTVWASVALALLGIVAIDAVAGGALRKSAIGFLNKGQGTETEAIDTEKVMASRTGMIKQSWDNFIDSPIYGIGFQVAKTEAFARNATWLTAPAEKGFLPTAVLEEGGVLGAVTFSLFLLAYFADVIRQRSIPALAMFVTFLACNFTEVSIFSPGGSGAFGWIMVGASLMLSDHCWRPPLERLRHGRVSDRGFVTSQA